MAKTDFICSVDGCGKSAYLRGWCASHYQRNYRYGSPLGGTTHKGEPMAFYRNTVLRLDTDECIIWPYGKTGKGYAAMNVDGRQKDVHRVACEDANGPPPTPEHEAAHTCGKGHMGCVNPKHLRWASRKENMADQYLHGTRMKGVSSGTAKLTEQDVRVIRDLKGRVPNSRIARTYGVDISHVRNIHSGKSWGWLHEGK